MTTTSDATLFPAEVAAPGPAEESEGGAMSTQELEVAPGLKWDERVPRIITVDTAGGQRLTLKVLFPDLLRPLTAEEREGLKEDIRKHGIVTPVIADGNCGVIDGANRLEIAAELGLRVPVEFRDQEMTAEEKRELALALNEHRRHLTPADLRRLRQERVARVAEGRRQGKSIRAIAEQEKVSVGQVQRDLYAAAPGAGVSPDTPGPADPADGAPDGQGLPSDPAGAAKPPTPCLLPKVTGRDGKTYRAKKRKEGGTGKNGDGKPMRGARKKKSKYDTLVVLGAVDQLIRMVEGGQVSEGDAQALANLPKPEQRKLAKAGSAAVKAKAADMRWLRGLPGEWRFQMQHERLDPAAEVSEGARREALGSLNKTMAQLQQSRDTIAGWIAVLKEKLGAEVPGEGQPGPAAA